MAAFSAEIFLKLKTEMSVSDEVSSGSQWPTNTATTVVYLSRGSMFEGCHSTSGESQSVNPPHYGRWFFCFVFRLMKRLLSNSNQDFCLANPKKEPTASRCRGSLIFGVYGVAPSCKNWLVMQRVVV